ncbi:MAG TPA: DUF2381 family protein [Myxococcaceae bacterium]|nr:DUF2381 family protein [Myxococcaceae bacterium]
MLSSLSVAFLALALLAALPAAAEPLSLPLCESGVRRIELVADANGKPPEVCIHDGLTTTFVVDSKRARMVLKERERFRHVAETADTFVLIPSELLRDGERIPLTFYFEDGAAPTSATLMLVVHPAQAEQQVEVSRHPRQVASYQQEARQARAEARRCLQEKTRIQAECDGPSGLTGPIALGLVGTGGISSRNLLDEAVVRPGATLAPLTVHGYRSTTQRREGGEQIVRLAVKLDLANGGTNSWKAAGAALIGPNGEALRILQVWQLEPISVGGTRSVVVEAEAIEREVRGPFILKLWAEDGVGGLTFDGITFP